ETELSKNIAGKIANALRKFDEATLSFRGFLLPRILPSFEVLDTNSEKHAPYNPKIASSISEIIESVDSASQAGIHEACEAIRGFAKEPSMSLFATIEDMRDAVTKTGDAVAARGIWSNLYAEHRSEVWSDVFQKKEADLKFRKEWDDAVEKLKTAVNTAAGI
ncbi:MAG: hypothetical protein LBT89_03620, partial [Planctomycetaceae bacterium]|nr:hypothetical protein [Planctomycetaceae bacterium]